jgi:hypothetical protein
LLGAEGGTDRRRAKHGCQETDQELSLHQRGTSLRAPDGWPAASRPNA